MNKRLWIVFAILVLGAVGGLIVWKKSENVETYSFDSLDGAKLLTVAEVGEGQIPDHFIGKKDSKVIAIAYEDFACSACNNFNESSKKIYQDYSDRVLFIYRNFNVGHPNSTVSISAGEAAYLVGGEDAYWKMYDLLFSEFKWTGSAISSSERESLLRSYAETAGIDSQKFLDEIKNYRENGIQTKMSRDESLGSRLKILSTPTWFVNGEDVGSVTDSNIRKSLDAALKSAK